MAVEPSRSGCVAPAGRTDSRPTKASTAGLPRHRRHVLREPSRRVGRVGAAGGSAGSTGSTPTQQDAAPTHQHWRAQGRAAAPGGMGDIILIMCWSRKGDIHRKILKLSRKPECPQTQRTPQRARFPHAEELSPGRPRGIDSFEKALPVSRIDLSWQILSPLHKKLNICSEGMSPKHMCIHSGKSPPRDSGCVSSHGTAWRRP